MAKPFVVDDHQRTAGHHRAQKSGYHHAAGFVGFIIYFIGIHLFYQYFLFVSSVNIV